MKKWRLFSISLLVLLVCAGSGKASRTEPGGYIALTFDDGPSGRITKRLLDGLEERGAKATFFLCGYRLEEYPKIAPLIAAGGHEIGLHGYSHNSMKDMSSTTLLEELHRTQQLIWEQTAQHSTLLRPPGGSCSDTVSRVAKAESFPIILWSLDTKDWTGLHSDAVAQEIICRAKDGDIILLHDMQMSSVEGALQAVDSLTEKGFVFVTVSELAELRGVEMEGGERYTRFPVQPHEEVK